MPHLYPQLRNDAQRALEARFGHGQVNIETRLAQMTADVVVWHVEEDVTVGKECICHPAVYRSSSPFSFLLIIEMDWKPEREPLFDVMVKEIARTISDWMPDLVVEVVLYVGGAPPGFPAVFYGHRRSLLPEQSDIR